MTPKPDGDKIMNNSKNFKAIANKLEELAYRNINKAIKKYTDGHKITGINDPILNNLDTSVMSDNDHMLYACGFETLTIIRDNGEEYA